MTQRIRTWILSHKSIILVIMGIIVISWVIIEAEKTKQNELLVTRLIEICKRDPTHGRYIDDFLLDLKEPRLWKSFITDNGDVYSVDDDWHIRSHYRLVAKPRDGEEHYCWAIEWHQGSASFIFWIDKDTEKIVSILFLIPL